MLTELFFKHGRWVVLISSIANLLWARILFSWWFVVVVASFVAYSMLSLVGTWMDDYHRASMPPQYVTKPTRSTQPYIPSWSIYWVPVLIGCSKGRMSPLLGGRQQCVIPHGIWVPVAVSEFMNCYIQLLYFILFMFMCVCQSGSVEDGVVISQWADDLVSAVCSAGVRLQLSLRARWTGTRSVQRCMWCHDVMYFFYLCLQCFDTVGLVARKHPACKNWVMRCW